MFTSLAEESVEKNIVQIHFLDKLYSENIITKMPTKQDFYYGTMKINVEKCIRNNKRETFAWISAQDNSVMLYEGWIPVSEYSSFPIQHSRYDIIIVSCSTYEDTK